MIASAYQPIKVTDYHCQPVRWVQPKLDGVRAVLRVTQSGVSMQSRSGLTDYWPQLGEQLSHLVKSVPVDSVIDGELHVAGTQSDEAISAVFAGDASFGVFGVPFWAGEPIEGIDTGLQVARAAGFLTVPTSPCEACPDPDQWRSRAQREGIEGYVFKHSAFSGWHRVKPVQTIDAVVVGFCRSTAASFRGGIKSLSLADASGRSLGRVGNGLSGEFRREVDPNSLLGRVAEIEFDSFTRGGKLRFPRFLRWRPDKTMPCGLFTSSS